MAKNWKPPKYPYKSVTLKGLQRMVRGRSLVGADYCYLIKVDEEGYEIEHMLDEGEFCPSCAEKHTGDGVDYVQPMDIPDDDGCRWCKDCGTPLDVWLTECGEKHEIEIWEEWVTRGLKLKTHTDYTDLAMLLRDADTWGGEYGLAGSWGHRLLAAFGSILGLPVGRAPKEWGEKGRVYE